VGIVSDLAGEVVAELLGRALGGAELDLGDPIDEPGLGV
jgi:hypothetical protein